MNGTRHGRSEGKRGGRKRAEEGGCNGAWGGTGRSGRGRDIGTEETSRDVP